MHSSIKGPPEAPPSWWRALPRRHGRVTSRKLEHRLCRICGFNGSPHSRRLHHDSAQADCGEKQEFCKLLHARNQDAQEGRVPMTPERSRLHELPSCKSACPVSGRRSPPRFPNLQIPHPANLLPRQTPEFLAPADRPSCRGPRPLRPRSDPARSLPPPAAAWQSTPRLLPGRSHPVPPRLARKPYIRTDHFKGRWIRIDIALQYGMKHSILKFCLTVRASLPVAD